MKVVFFKPKMPEGQFNPMNWHHGITATPGIEAAFYMDVSARSIDAVESMKKYFFRSRVYVITIVFTLRSGSWPSMTYTKCSEFTSKKPTLRSLNLVSAIKVR